MNALACGHGGELRKKRWQGVLYRCPACKRWQCGLCTGTDDEDFRYCDDCAARRVRRRARRGGYTEQDFLNAMARECRCCPTCTGSPCPACTAGGVCDDVECRCFGDEHEERSDDACDDCGFSPCECIGSDGHG